jgi:hypothetical protein
MKSFKDIFTWVNNPNARKIHLTVNSEWYLYSYEGRLLTAHGCEQSYGGSIFEGEINHCAYCQAEVPTSMEVAGKLLVWGNDYE